MTTAELLLVVTSPECTCYRLVVGSEVIWRTRAFTARPESHAGARDRMAAWAILHKVTVTEAQPEPAQTIIKGRYGRH